MKEFESKQAREFVQRDLALTEALTQFHDETSAKIHRVQTSVFAELQEIKNQWYSTKGSLDEKLVMLNSINIEEIRQDNEFVKNKVEIALTRQITEEVAAQCQRQLLSNSAGVQLVALPLQALSG